MLIERLVTSLEMYNRCSRCATDAREIFRNPRKNNNGREAAQKALNFNTSERFLYITYLYSRMIFFSQK